MNYFNDINNIYDFVSKRGGKMILVLFPQVHDIKHKSKFELIMSSICTGPEYEINYINKKNCVFFDEFKKKYFEQIVNDNYELYQHCFKSYSKEYVHNISIANIDKLMVDNNYFYNSPIVSKSIDVYNGIRYENNYVCYNNKHNIFLFGNSTSFGYYVNNNETITYYLRNYIYDYNVHNCSTVGENIHNMSKRIMDFSINEGDIVLVGYPLCLYEESMSIFPTINLLSCFIHHNEYENFIDSSHYTSMCHQNIATYLYHKLFNVLNVPKHDNHNDEISDELCKVCENVIKIKNNNEIGATVMSCNPFTKGHRHLIEIGSKMFDYFIVFLMQEGIDLIFDKKICSDIVKNDVEDLNNVIVIDMPNVFSYQKFWPQYNDATLRHSNNFQGLDTSKLLNIVQRSFEKLNIKHFLCGIELDDNITKQHITQAKYIFQQHGINVLCIPRKKLHNQQFDINGTLCRQYLTYKQYDKLKYSLTEKTLQYLINNNVNAKLHTNNNVLRLIDKNVKNKNNDIKNNIINKLNMKVITIDTINEYFLHKKRMYDKGGNL